jgi:bifunctional non-homologous end joining protein LigD
MTQVIIPSSEDHLSADVVEVRYLYAYPGGSLYQPVYVGKRDDVEPAACTIGQLKFKPADEEC